MMEWPCDHLKIYKTLRKKCILIRLTCDTKNASPNKGPPWVTSFFLGPWGWTYIRTVVQFFGLVSLQITFKRGNSIWTDILGGPGVDFYSGMD